MVLVVRYRLIDLERDDVVTKTKRTDNEVVLEPVELFLFAPANLIDDLEETNLKVG